MYLDGMSFLEEEREAWRPYEALAELADEDLERPADGAHGWSGRDLMSHLAAWQEWALNIARELAVATTSPTYEKLHALDWDREGDAINAAQTEAWRLLPLDEVRRRFESIPGELRGYLTVVPETRWLKNAPVMRTFLYNTLGHYEEHEPDLRAVLAAAGR